MALIKVTHVSKFFGSAAAVADISFDVQEGENFILLGTSGCGKTTTLKMINRLIPVSDGTISVNGKDIREQAPEALRKGMGYVLQHNSLFPHYTIAENIAVVPRLLRWEKHKTEARIKELLQKLHLPGEYTRKYPHELSGGEAQRVNVARALAADPPVLLMDEPFGALDPVTRTAIRKEFSELDEFKRKTILMVTHDIQEAFSLGDRICLMDKGKIMQVGTPEDLLFQPANDFVKRFLADAQLQLALMTTRITALWPYLEPTEGTETDNVLDNNTSLWQAMEQLNDKEPMLWTLAQDGDRATRKISTARLWQAFAEYKKHR